MDGARSGSAPWSPWFHHGKGEATLKTKRKMNINVYEQLMRAANYEQVVSKPQWPSIWSEEDYERPRFFETVS